MRKTTKILSLLLTLAMMLTMAVPMTVSAAAFTDVPANHQYYDAITNLSAEGILNGFEDGSFKPGDPVTRAQFTKIICYALSVGDLTYSEEERSIFSDLAPEHWAANNIVTAYKQGIINGMGDGTFAPEAGVQYEQAVKMVVCALGYSQARADALGGYPGGYMSLANSAKLLKGITDAKMYEVMNRGAVAQLIDNMLDADQIQDGQPSGSLREEVSTSKKVDGQVVAGYGVALYDNVALNACRKNEILVKLGTTNVAYDISEIKNFDIYEFLGRSVTVYYEEESGVAAQVASSIALQPRKNETIKIDLDMIYDYDASSIEYYVDDERTETEIVNYQSGANVLWNGQPTTDNVQTLLTSHGTKSGYITLVSSKSNQAADVVFLKTYDTVVVNSVDTKNYKVFGKRADAYNSGIVLDVTDRSKNVTIKSNGSDFAFSSIRANHILSISKSADGKVIEVLVSTKTASGTIESASGTAGSTPEAPKEFKLNTSNVTYTVSPVAYAESGSLLEVGKHVTISLDAFGKVASYVVTAESAYNYGYISSLEEKNSVSSPELWVMIYKPVASNSTLTGGIYKFADRVKINGTNYSIEDKKDDILDILLTSANLFNTGTTVNDAGDVYAQPIRYTLNNQNQVNAILTGTEEEGPVGDNTTKLNLINNVAGIACTVDASTFGQYRITGSTPVIYIPADRATGTYSSKTNNLFEEGKTYYAQFANTSSAGVIGCIYLYGVNEGSLNATITDENRPLIVKSKGAILYKDVETTVMVLIDVTTGDEITCYEDSVSLASYEVGDVVRVAIGADNYVEDIELLADSSAVVAGTFNYDGNYWYTGEGNSDDVTADFRVVIARVWAKETGTLQAELGYTADGTGSEPFVVSDSIPVYKIDTAASETLRIESGSIGDVIAANVNSSAASKVLIYTVDGIAKAIIIFE